MARTYKRLSATERCEMVELVESGEITATQAAEDYGVAESTVFRVLRQFRDADKRLEEMEAPVTEKVVAGDKENGQLRRTGHGVYEGSCRRSDGKMARRTFRASGFRDAKAQWDEWCVLIRAEDEVPEWVREAPDESAARVPELMEESAVEPEPEPEPDPEPEPEVVPGSEEVPEQNPDPQPEVEGTIYVVFLKTTPIRSLGSYWSFEDAMAKCDAANDLLTMAGHEPICECFESELKLS